MRFATLVAGTGLAALITCGPAGAAPFATNGLSSLAGTADGVTAVSRLMPYEFAPTQRERAARVPNDRSAVVRHSPAVRSVAPRTQDRQRNQEFLNAQRLAALGDQPSSQRMDPRFLPADVEYTSGYKPGTIVIDTDTKYLYHITGKDTARRYGVGVGRPGFQWAGTHRVSMKREWPGWTPPPQMRKRQPELPAYMPGGPDNPLGARALYLGSTLYRIHGSNAPWSIGQAVSSGCIRMRNEDVIELYERVKVGTRVVVKR